MVESPQNFRTRGIFFLSDVEEEKGKMGDNYFNELVKVSKSVNEHIKFKRISPHQLTMTITKRDTIPKPVHLKVVATAPRNSLNNECIITLAHGSEGVINAQTFNCATIGLLIHDITEKPDGKETEDDILAGMYYGMLAPRAQSIHLINNTLSRTGVRQCYIAALDYATPLGKNILSISKITDGQFMLKLQPDDLPCTSRTLVFQPSYVVRIHQELLQAMNALAVFKGLESCSVYAMSHSINVGDLKNDEIYKHARARADKFYARASKTIDDTKVSQMLFLQLVSSLYCHRVFGENRSSAEMCALVFDNAIPFSIISALMLMKFKKGKHDIIMTPNGTFTKPEFWDGDNATINVVSDMKVGGDYPFNRLKTVNVEDINGFHGMNVIRWLHPLNESSYLVDSDEINGKLRTEMLKYYNGRSLDANSRSASSHWMQHIVFLLMRATARYMARNLLQLAPMIDLYETILDPLDAPWDVVCFYSLHLYVTEELLDKVIVEMNAPDSVNLVFDNAINPERRSNGEWFITNNTRPPNVRRVSKSYFTEDIENTLPFVTIGPRGQMGATYLFFPHRAWFKAVPKELLRCFVSIFARWAYFQEPFPSKPTVMIKEFLHYDTFTPHDATMQSEITRLPVETIAVRVPRTVTRRGRAVDPEFTDEEDARERVRNATVDFDAGISSGSEELGLD